MADEHSKSAEQPSDTSPPSAHSGGSKIVRIIIWGLVGVFAFVALMDIASRQGFSTTLANLEDGMDKAEEPLTLGDFESQFKSGLAIKTTGSKNGVSTILYKWPSLFRPYELHLTVEPGDEQLLASYSTNDDPAALIGRPGSEGDGTEDEGGGPGGGPGMGHEEGIPGAGAPGGGGPGGEGRGFGRRGGGGPGEGGEGRPRRPSSEETGDDKPEGGDDQKAEDEKPSQENASPDKEE